jgi:hypothetical protein
VTEKRITKYEGFGVRKFHNLEFLTVLELGNHIFTLEHDVVPSHETIAQQDCSEVKRLRQSITQCRTRREVSTKEKLASSANMQKRKRQEDGRADDAGKTSKINAGKTSKEKNRKETLQKHLTTMTLDKTATFVDHVFATIEILCGMIDQSRAAMLRSSIEPIVMHFNCDTIIDLTMLLDDETPTAPKCSWFHKQELPLPSAATVEGATVKIPNNYSNILLTASDVARYHKERKIVPSLDKVLSRDRSQQTQHSQRLLAGFASSHPTISPDSQALLIGMARYTFMLDLESIMKENKKRMMIATNSKEKWSISNNCNMEMALRSSPSASAIDNWVVNLALEQALISSAFFQNCGAVYLMSGGGHKGSQVKLLSGWDDHDTS